MIVPSSSIFSIISDLASAIPLIFLKFSKWASPIFVITPICGFTSLDNYIGDPGDQNLNSYPDLIRIAQDYWKKYVGISGLTFVINEFGKSAPYKDIFKHFGLTVSNIASKTKKMLGNYTW